MFTKKEKIIFALFVVFLFSVLIIFPAIQYEHWRSQFVTCIDGDTFKKDNTVYRLSYVDTPEINEKGYYDATIFSCNYFLTYGVTIKKHGKDIYGRTLAEVFVDNVSLNEELIKNCLAEPFWSNTTDRIRDLYDARCYNKVKK